MASGTKMKAHVFPGQGSQFPGMARDLYDSCARAKELFEDANDILGFRITDVMFEGTDDAVKSTDIAQPAIFLHSVISHFLAMERGEDRPDMVAGHSLGEFSALVANGALDFEDGLRLVRTRAGAMQECCGKVPGAMAAIIKLPAEKIEEICAAIPGVVPANYNHDSQIVISGTTEAVEEARARMLEAGAKRALLLQVGGAFHSPLMEPAKEILAEAIERTSFHTPVCPVYQNVTAEPTTDPEIIRANLLAQLTSPVRWTQSVRRMVSDGAEEFIEFGPGQVLTGLCSKIVSALAK